MSKPVDQSIETIISIDGGGLYGIVPLCFLKHQYENQSTPHKCLYAGTSVGGLICALMSQYAPGVNVMPQVEKQFRASAPIIFKAKNKWSFWGLRGPKYSHKGAEQVLKDLIIKKPEQPIMLTTYDALNRSTYIYKSWTYDWNNHFDMSLKQFRAAILATMSAPTYFPGVRHYYNPFTSRATEPRYLIDGAMSVNNPTDCALAEVLKLRNSEGIELDTYPVVVNSYGCGENKNPRTGVYRWGLIEWAKNIAGVTLDGGVDTVHYKMRQLHNTLPWLQYNRFDIQYDEHSFDCQKVLAMDNLKLLDDLTFKAELRRFVTGSRF